MAPIHVGALAYAWQAIDVVGPMDLLGSCGKDILGYIKTNHTYPITQETLDRSPEIVFHHIAETRDSDQLLSSGITIKPTDTVDDCPELDILILGGPLPEGFKLHPSYVDFVKRHNDAKRIIFTTCTGAVALATTGLLDGKNATVNLVEYNWSVKEFPNVKWCRDKKWVVDGNIWTAGGAVVGMDMVAHWILENFGLEVLIAGTAGLDYEPRDVDGLFNVLPQRKDEDGKPLPTHVFP